MSTWSRKLKKLSRNLQNTPMSIATTTALTSVLIKIYVHLGFTSKNLINCREMGFKDF